ncbi:hypothetical protein WICPIJ_006518 [Wickerhamomyces pijperi]|uniref:Uncharacterized protein n=1 Tax=Wickerhamomyces pijperi TaxID=599730 RepID=A0A9P8Q3M8_WICPI|nr:hypothetical protein WICPIJ_006518 [Wickerhamomyces pijperi]
MPHRNNNSTFNSRFKVYPNRIEKVLYATPSISTSTNAHNVSLISIPPPNSSVNAASQLEDQPSLWQGSVRLNSIESLYSGYPVSKADERPIRGVLEMINHDRKVGLAHEQRLRNYNIGRNRNTEQHINSIFATIEIELVQSMDHKFTLSASGGSESVYELMFKDFRDRMVMLGLKFDNAQDGKEFGEALMRLTDDIKVMDGCIKLRDQVVRLETSEAVNSQRNGDNLDQSMADDMQRALRIRDATADSESAPRKKRYCSYMA